MQHTFSVFPIFRYPYALELGNDCAFCGIYDQLDGLKTPFNLFIAESLSPFHSFRPNTLTYFCVFYTELVKFIVPNISKILFCLLFSFYLCIQIF